MAITKTHSIKSTLKKAIDYICKSSELHAAFDEKRKSVKAVEARLNGTAVMLKNIKIYTEFKPIYLQYQKAKNKEQFERQHQRELILYKAAVRALKASDNIPQLADAEKEYAELSARKTALYKEYRELKNKCSEIDVIKSNVEAMLNIEPTPERDIVIRL